MRRLSVVFVLALALVGLAPASYAADPPTITGIAARSGPLRGGDLVTIRGYHLTGTTAVLFGGISSSTDLQVLDDTHLQVRTPAHPQGGSYVQVVRPDATSAQSYTAVYDYVAPPDPLRFGPQHPRPRLLGQAMSCASGSLCVVAGAIRSDASGTIYGVTVKRLGTWSAARQFSHFSIDGASCVLRPRLMCMTTGEDGYASRYDGRTWHRTRVASLRQGLTDVSCVTSSFCMAVDTAGYAYRWNGTRWSGPTNTRTARLTQISCATTAFCYAMAGGEGSAVRWISGQWRKSHHTYRPGGGGLNYLECSSPTFCLATGDFEAPFLAFTGVAWSPLDDSNPGPLLHARAPSTCTSPLFCVFPASDTGDDRDLKYVVYNGDTTQSTPPAATYPDANFVRLSCWAAYQCISVDASTWQYVGRDS